MPNKVPLPGATVRDVLASEATIRGSRSWRRLAVYGAILTILCCLGAGATFLVDRHDLGRFLTPRSGTLHLHYTAARLLVAASVVTATLVMAAACVILRGRKRVVATVGWALIVGLALSGLQQSPAAFSWGLPDPASTATYATGEANIFPRPEMHELLLGALLTFAAAGFAAVVVLPLLSPIIKLRRRR